MGSTRSFVWQCILLIVCVAVVAFLAPSEAKVWVVICGALCFVVFFAVLLFRRKQIIRLAYEIDEVLHTGRNIDFSNCYEGDISVLRNELSKVVSRLARANQQLEESKSALADALADVSHQIRTPLTAAALMLPKIERTKDELERKRAVRELEVMLDRVSWLVTSLLKIAKADAGAIHVESRHVVVNDVVTRAVEPLEAVADLRGVSIVVSKENDASFMGDLLWTTEALENIIKNCLEHTPTGGSVFIETTEDSIVTRITVSDTGSGIAEDDLPHIFERFYRGHVGETDTEFEGFGIGLSLAQVLISVQGGSLSASNESSGGAKFVVAFPKLAI